MREKADYHKHQESKKMKKQIKDQTEEIEKLRKKIKDLKKDHEIALMRKDNEMLQIPRKQDFEDQDVKSAQDRSF